MMISTVDQEMLSTGHVIHLLKILLQIPAM